MDRTYPLEGSKDVRRDQFYQTSRNIPLRYTSMDCPW